ncbi:MAG: hypothetical protein GWN01_01350 [Nitrosopumilaceae archaeon]|nr:fibronectin type III domain-containing protein [Nitrosopumilaceae archaeon]NIU86005.1 hypothetical protein [Nitrosopumilaceae archaeon]NIX60224.1 hypothetical protein [Nitrosopumilaceae archaeon]
MVNVKITKTSVEDFGTETFVVESDIYESLRVVTNTPMFVADLPQQSEEETIVIKVVGNVQRLTYSFKLVDKNGTNLVTSGLSSGIDTSTVEGQWNFLLNEFRPTGIEDSYKFELTSPFSFVRDSNLESLDIEFREGDPINPICTMVFVVGNIQTDIDEYVPQEPPISVSVSDVGGDPEIEWTNVAAADEGGSAITGYQVERRSEIGSWEVLTQSATSPFSDTTASDVSGTVYKYRVAAVNDQGVGPKSKIVKHTRP